MSKPVDLEVFIAMNEDGEWIAVPDEEEALGTLFDVHGGSRARLVKLKVTMAPPSLDEVAVTVPDNAEALLAKV